MEREEISEFAICYLSFVITAKRCGGIEKANSGLVDNGNYSARFSTRLCGTRQSDHSGAGRQQKLLGQETKPGRSHYRGRRLSDRTLSQGDRGILLYLERYRPDETQR